MKRINRMLFIGFFTLICISCNTEKEVADYQVIPLPQEISLTSEEKPFTLNTGTLIAYPNNNLLLKKNAEFLSEYLQETLGYTLEVKEVTPDTDVNNTITLGLNPTIENKEGYILNITSNGVTIDGKTEQGVFYGIQTLRKSIPAVSKAKTVLLPVGCIKDEPRFAYRGMHLDVCRHFFPVEFVKKYIDLLALHNMNTFHWHLTDDQGWRIEIKKYPKLTEIGSTRNRTMIGKNRNLFDNTPYGGFYTQEQAREIVKYAQERYITVIPEVDLPGHMLAVLASYPEFGCTGGPYEVCPKWGIFPDVLCIGNEQAMLFLEDVMTEIIDIFPSPYIHIGGDEAPRVRWKNCAKCQARIKAEKLYADEKHSAEDRLQSYCMARIEKFINERGRRIIGWDEILDGDVAPNATIMSWRGTTGGIKAAQMGHDVIMTPNTYCYLDYYQTNDIDNEPLAIRGYIPVKRVYSLEPTESLTEKQAKHILGVQANLWTEYIATTEHVEYMILPRMAALAEVQWLYPAQKDYTDFTKRLIPLTQFYKRDSLNYAKHIFDVQGNFTLDAENKTITATLSTIDEAPIYYTLDGTEPTTNSPQYIEPITISHATEIRAVTIRPEGKSRIMSQKLAPGKSAGCPIELDPVKPTERFLYKGATTLVDGMKGGECYTSGEWIGFTDGDVTATIDLGYMENISRVSTSAYIDVDSWIMGSLGLTVSVSNDKVTFHEVANKDYPSEKDLKKKGIEEYKVEFEPIQARYIKITIKCTPVLPEGHVAAGRIPFMLIDEIDVN
ncbi:glycoside hydrolase family 20 protein [Bacteroides nordii]|uniref:glycoside hydrolase family 20 protein n=1 Tax=Bacteroides nordii TaxID=291645 RepID=UPI001898AA86|nr:family 20 glycosylhydrolase [Bacteroides nordii]